MTNENDTLTEEQFFQWAQKKGAESAQAAPSSASDSGPRTAEPSGPPPQDPPQDHSGPEPAKPQNDAGKGDDFSNYIFQGGSRPGNPGEDPSEKARDQEAFHQKMADTGPGYKAKSTARFASMTFDSLFSAMAQQYAEAPSRKPYKAEDEEMDDLIEAAAAYLETVGADIPPGVMLLLIVMVIYVPKSMQAAKDRKANRGQQSQKSTSQTREEEDHSGGVEEVDAEAVDDSTVDFSTLVSDFNQKARRLGLEEIDADRPVPPGLCKYHFYINGKQVKAQAGQFASSSEQSRWGQQCIRWKKAGLDYKFLIEWDVT